MEKKTFIKSLNIILETGKKQQALIHELGCYALETVNLGKTTGKDSPIQMLWDTIAQCKAINHQAFIDWCQSYGFLRFVKLQDKTMIVKYKDKAKEMDAIGALELAKATPFWEFAKEVTPNTKPFNVFDALKQVKTHAIAAATGGAKGDKPIRVIEQKEYLDVIEYILSSNLESVRERLGLSMPSAKEVPSIEEEEAEVITVEDYVDTFDQDDFDELQELISRQGLRAA